MFLGLSVSTFTLLHVIVSLIGIAAGVIVVIALLRPRAAPGWTALFRFSTALTSVSGFMFHSKSFGQLFRLSFL